MLERSRSSAKYAGDFDQSIENDGGPGSGSLTGRLIQSKQNKSAEYSQHQHTPRTIILGWAWYSGHNGRNLLYLSFQRDDFSIPIIAPLSQLVEIRSPSLLD